MTKPKNHKATPFLGTKIFVQTGLGEAMTVTEATLSPATITIANNKLKADDMIMLSGLGELDGRFPVAQVDGNKVTLCDEVDWSDKTLPTDFSSAKAQRIQWSNNFCAVKSFSKDGSTTEQIDVTTICSDGKEYESGDTEYGSIKLTFFLRYSSSEVQRLLRKYENSKEKFAVKMVLTRNEGSMFYYGSVETGMNIDGSVGQMMDSGISIKLSGRDYLNAKK
ncbi:TPA: hypothetical protein ACKRTJ_003674 [Proteus mirabilis]|uniref:hypothetical protein n=1 Tax=Proteus mirabilis TaxID=584 RepID=UPI0005380AB7|nr:hypothetical protein [Proteus mirabilis]AUU39497.1 hypothetical protein MC73_011115 [Proteus mirabilis]EKV7295904.1 hypothetical protein [Proteus mirabilis]EKX9514811.1 hypothetical protein [Proteus mirabilis]ELB3501589.1 hypothetical protein [Proteus mirabilis]ELT1805479.1 hypothetical protein [Proteus mirabilis]